MQSVTQRFCTEQRNARQHPYQLRVWALYGRSGKVGGHHKPSVSALHVRWCLSMQKVLHSAVRMSAAVHTRQRLSMQILPQGSAYFCCCLPLAVL
jgi:hypothetical protein